MATNAVSATDGINDLVIAARNLVNADACNYQRDTMGYGMFWIRQGGKAV